MADRRRKRLASVLEAPACRGNCTGGEVPGSRRSKRKSKQPEAYFPCEKISSRKGRRSRSRKSKGISWNLNLLVAVVRCSESPVCSSVKLFSMVMFLCGACESNYSRVLVVLYLVIWYLAWTGRQSGARKQNPQQESLCGVSCSDYLFKTGGYAYVVLNSLEFSKVVHALWFEIPAV